MLAVVCVGDPCILRVQVSEVFFCEYVIFLLDYVVYALLSSCNLNSELNVYSVFIKRLFPGEASDLLVTQHTCFDWLFGRSVGQSLIHSFIHSFIHYAVNLPSVVCCVHYFR